MCVRVRDRDRDREALYRPFMAYVCVCVCVMKNNDLEHGGFQALIFDHNRRAVVENKRINRNHQMVILDLYVYYSAMVQQLRGTRRQ